jgi:acyl carrier protein
VDRGDTYERLCAIVSEVMECSVDRLSTTTELRSLGATSLDLLEIATKVEEAFEIRMSEQLFGEQRTLGDVVSVIDGLRAAG